MTGMKIVLAIGCVSGVLVFASCYPVVHDVEHHQHTYPEYDETIPDDTAETITDQSDFAPDVE